MKVARGLLRAALGQQRYRRAMNAKKRLEVIYRDHHLLVEAAKRSTWWSWSYLIEGRVQGTGHVGTQLDADAALTHGLSAAKACVDEMLDGLGGMERPP